jgi:hypothetical protein
MKKLVDPFLGDDSADEKRIAAPMGAGTRIRIDKASAP